MAGRIFEVTVSLMYFGQQCINRWNYLADVAVGGNQMSAGLAEEFGLFAPGEDPNANSVLAQLQACTNGAGVFTDITVRDLYSDFDFLEAPLGFNGTVTGEGYTPAMAYGFYSQRTRLDIRRGFKRIPGVSEGAVGTGGVLAGTGITMTNELAVKMSLNLSQVIAGTNVVFKPVILGKEKYQTNPGIEPAKYAYKLYQPEAEQLAHVADVGVWFPYTQVRTQGSRQYGRGQ